MSKLGNVLWKLYLKGDSSTILVLDYFQREPYTYVKVVVNDGKRDIIIQTITEDHASPFQSVALHGAIQSAIEKAADIITAQALAPVIAEFSSDPV